MRLLVIGGSRFVGRHIVESALAAGHEVTVFNRGLSAPGLFTGVEQLTGDRDGGLAPLAGRRWDAVIDTPGYVPRVVRQSVELLRDSGKYVFISSLSALAAFDTPGMDESSPLAKPPDPSVETVTGETYGGLKVACERQVEEVFPGRSVLVRAGYIVGPNDPTDRLTYWIVRGTQGGEMLAPGTPADPIQFIDVRDLARWVVAAATGRHDGPYHLTGPATSLRWGTFLELCTAGHTTSLRWVAEPSIIDPALSEGLELPIWAPPHEAGIHQISIRKALDSGLTLRPVEETIRDTLAWRAMDDRPLAAGLTRERERELLALARRS